MVRIRQHNGRCGAARVGIALTLLLAALLVRPATAGAAITTPSCAALLTFAGTVNPHERWWISVDQRTLALPAAFHTPDFAHLFGVPALAWTAADVKAAQEALTVCARHAAHARRRREAGQLAWLRRPLGGIGYVVTKIAQIEAALDAQFHKLLALPPSRDQLAALVVLDHAHGPAGSVAAAQHFAAEDLGRTAPVRGAPGQVLSYMLRTLAAGPPGMADRLYPTLAERRTALAPEVTAAAAAAFDKLPASLEGLAALPRLKQQTAQALGPIVPAAAMAALDRHEATRKTAIEQGIAAGLDAEIAKVPTDNRGPAALQRIAASREMAALPKPLQAAVTERIAAQQDHIRQAKAAREDARQAQVQAKIAAEIAAEPPTLDGLAALKTRLTQPDATALSPERQAALAALIAPRRAAMLEAIKAKMLTDIAGAPASADGVRLLDLIGRSGQFAALEPPERAAVTQALAARRGPLLDAIIAESIDGLKQYHEASGRGLDDLARYTRATDAAFAAAAGPARMARFHAAAQARFGMLGRTALPDFRKTLAAAPATHEGLAAIEAGAKQLAPVLADFPPDLRAHYVDLLKERHDAIAAAVAQEDARLAALPLNGATYANADDSMRIRFRNATHAFFTVGAPADSAATTLDVTYEADGTAVILHGLPRGNVVFTRQGGFLVGEGLRFRRQGK